MFGENESPSSRAADWLAWRTTGSRGRVVVMSPRRPRSVGHPRDVGGQAGCCAWEFRGKLAWLPINQKRLEPSRGWVAIGPGRP